MNFMEKEKNIGVLDSGYGGLTVVKKIISALPKENIIYLGDTAGAPYGSRSEELILAYSKKALQYLLNKNVKLIIISSNTISSVACDELKKNTTVPIINIVYAGAKKAVESKTKKTGVIGSAATISNSAYSRYIRSQNQDIDVVEKATQALVPLIEDGSINKNILAPVLVDYLSDLGELKIDSLILGSAYYRLIKAEIQRVVGNDVNLVDPYDDIGLIVKSELERIGLQTNSAGLGNQDYCFSDITNESGRISKMFLDVPLKAFKKVNL
jgi:glutamate racemase